MSSGATSRYDTILKLASGGMATVYVGNVRGALGFRQLVAIKKPHPHLLEDASYRQELVTEARLASLIRHANVVDVRDVEVDGDSISLVMDYIEGASLGELVVAASKRGGGLSPRVAVRIALDALAGLHAAHELVDERGRHVSLVHRDVSPQNILVGVDGLARVADFGVAKFSRKTDSSEGSLKGKLAYMAPEYLRGEAIDRRFDIFALGIVLWETLAGKRLFRGKSEAETLRMLLEHEPESLADVAPAAAALDGILKTALARPVAERFQNAQAMAAALETTAIAAGLCGGHTEVAAALKELVGDAIEQRRALVRASLAHEPSLASLMGNAAPPAVTDAAIANATIPNATIPNTTIVDSAVPATVADVPVTVITEPHKARTPRLGGAFELAPNARTEPLGAAMNPALAVVPGPLTSVPSTVPMTPRMKGAPERTLASPAASPRRVPVAASSGATLASAAPMADPSAPRVDAIGDTQLSFNDPSARSAYDPIPKPPSNKTLPIALGLVAIVIAGGAILFAATRTTPSAAQPPPHEVPVAAESAAATPAPSSTASTAPSPTTSVATASAPAPAATPSAASAQPSARRPAKPAGPPTGTSKKPPPNPYATE